LSKIYDPDLSFIDDGVFTIHTATLKDGRGLCLEATVFKTIEEAEIYANVLLDDHLFSGHHHNLTIH